MLSKLRHFAGSNAGDLAGLRSRIDVRPALEQLGAPRAPFAAVSGGTLGVGFMATIDGHQRFLKTCASEHGKGNLEKEIRILSHLYGETLGIRRLEVAEDDATPRVWLVMDALRLPDAPLNPSDTLSLIEDYRSRLVSLAPGSLETADTVGTLVDDANRGLAALLATGQIGQSMHDTLHSRLAYLAREWQSFPRCVAHGDLGPRNIMATSDRAVVIDWEDAFLGVDGYDYLYWLTFFENRRHYGQGILGRTPLGVDAEVALLAMILILKSDLSLRANTHAGNQLTAEQRIGEVLALV